MSGPNFERRFLAPTFGPPSGPKEEATWRPNLGKLFGEQHLPHRAISCRRTIPEKVPPGGPQNRPGQPKSRQTRVPKTAPFLLSRLQKRSVCATRIPEQPSPVTVFQPLSPSFESDTWQGRGHLGPNFWTPFGGRKTGRPTAGLQKFRPKKQHPKRHPEQSGPEVVLCPKSLAHHRSHTTKVCKEKRRATPSPFC